jgi:serine protease SohB
MKWRPEKSGWVSRRSTSNWSTNCKTSDEYLATKAKTAEVFHLHYAERKSLQERIGLAASGSVDRVLLTWWSRLTQQRFW